MDEVVKQAMARWPNVPECYGWLALDRRGQWRMRNEYAQQHGLSGDPIRHAALIGFIERNYQSDVRGAWYFQNGPQRVYLSLAYTPWVVRLHQQRFETTTQRAFTVTACFADEHGSVLVAGSVDGESGTHVALVHDHDLDAFSTACTWHGEACGGDLGTFHHAGKDLPIEPIVQDEVPKRFAFCREPASQG